MLSRISLGYKRYYKICPKAISYIRSCSINDGSIDNNFVDGFTGGRQSNIKKIREKLENSNSKFKKVLMQRMTVTDQKHVFVSFDRYIDEDTLCNKDFSEDLALEVVRSSVSPSIAKQFNLGVEPNVIIKTTPYDILRIPVHPRNGIWFTDNTKR